MLVCSLLPLLLLHEEVLLWVHASCVLLLDAFLLLCQVEEEELALLDLHDWDLEGPLVLSVQ